MNRKTWLIVLGVIAAVLVCGGALVTAGALTYFSLRDNPANALAASLFTIENNEGILVACVEPDSPADLAGISRGDVIIEINGATVNGDAALYEFLGRAEPGDTLEMVVKHGDDRWELDVTLAEQDGDPYLGINHCMSAFWGHIFADKFIQDGALIIEVVPDGPADAAGLQAGDQILSVDGEQVNDEQSLSDLVSSYQPGDEVVLEVVSPEEDARQVPVTLGEHPDNEDNPYLGVTYRSIPAVVSGEGTPSEDLFPILPEYHEGFFRMFPPGYEEMPGDFDWTFPDDGEWGWRFKFDFQFPDVFPEDVEGAVIVHYVTADSPADASGLEAGMMITEINGEPIEGVDAFVDTIKSMNPGDEVSLTVYRPGEENTTVIDIVLGEDPENPEQAYLGVSIAGGFFNYHFDEMDEDDTGLEERLPFLRNIFPRLPYLRDILPDIPGLENLPGRLQELLSKEDA